MKILIVTHYFQPHTGGIEIVAYNQAKELVKRGHTVTIVTSRIGSEPKEERIEGIRVIRVKVLNFLEGRYAVPYPIFSPRLLWILNSEAKATDVIHAHGHMYLTSLVAAIMAKRHKKGLVIMQHNTFIQYKSGFLRTMQRIVDYSIGKFVLANANKILVVSKETKKYVDNLTKGKKESVVLYNAVDNTKFIPAEDKKKLRVEKNIKVDSLTCFTVRRITYKNGIDTYVRVAEKAKSNKIQFLLGGKGPDLESVRNYVKEHKLVNFTPIGFISDQDLPKYYAMSDIFILPSKKGEGFPLVVLEAFACGLPVIATNSGGHVEIIQDGVNGYIVDSEKPEQITEKIEYLEKNPDLLHTMSNNCLKMVASEFNWGNNVGKLYEYYEEAVKNGSQR